MSGENCVCSVLTDSFAEMQPLSLQQFIACAMGVRCALVVSGSPRRTAPPLVSQLARHATFIVAVDSGAEVVRAAGLVPDLLLGDFDSANPETLAYFQASDVEAMRYDTHKDATDIELALEVVRQRGYSTVIVTNALGGRLDHELATLGCLAASSEQGMVVCVVEDAEVCVFLSRAAEGSTAALHSNLELVGLGTEHRGSAGHGEAAPSFISLIPWGGDATVTAKGLEWELDHATLKSSSSRGVSNVPTNEHITIEVHEGTMLVVLQICKPMKLLDEMA